MDDDEEWNAAFEQALAAVERNGKDSSCSSPSDAHNEEWNEDLEAELRRLEDTLLQRGHGRAAVASATGNASDYDEAMERELQALENAHVVKE